jgi:hypothetical protein
MFVEMLVQDLFSRLTLESTGKVGFGVELSILPWKLPLPDHAFAKAYDSISEIISWRNINPFWKLKRRLSIGCEAVLADNIKVIDSFTYGVISQRKCEMSTAIYQQGVEVRDCPH